MKNLIPSDEVIEAVAAYMRQKDLSSSLSPKAFSDTCLPHLRAAVQDAIGIALQVDHLLIGEPPFNAIAVENQDWLDDASAASISPIDSDLVGDIFGNYRLTRSIGRGGMGVVYQARLVEDGCDDPGVRPQLVAVKVIRGGLGEVAIKRFCREAEATKQLHHPNIVPVYELGQTGSCFYYVMKFAGSGTVRHWLDESKFESTSERWRQISLAIAEAADGLQFAHDRGILHRDVKPSNLLVDESGAVMLADFGLTRRIDDETLTAKGDLVGTLRYLPPEAFDSSTDHRSDIYSLGATLFELIAGYPLHEADEPFLLMRSITHRVGQSVGQFEPSLPRSIVGIVDRAVHLNPARRYKSAAAMADDLRRYAAGDPVFAVPMGTLERRLTRWIQNPAALLTGSILLAVLIAVAVCGPLLAVRFSRLAAESRAAQANAERSLRDSQTASRLKRQTTLNALLSDAESRAASGKIGQNTESLNLIGQAIELADQDAQLKRSLLNRWNLPWDQLIQRMVIAAVSQPDLELVHRWHSPNAGDGPVAFSGDLLLHVRHDFSSGNNRIVIADTSGKIIRHVPMPKFGYASWIGWCDRADKVCLRIVEPEKSRIWIWDLTTDSFEPSGWPTSAALHSEIVQQSGDLIYQSSDLRLCRVSLLAKAAEPVFLTPPQEKFHQPFASPDGRRVAVHYDDRHRVDLVDLETLEVDTLQLDQSVDCLAWRPDSRCLAVSGDEVEIHDLVNGRVIHRQANRHGMHYQLLYSADGEWLFCNGRRGFTQCWDATLSTSLLRSEMVPLTASSDGELIAMRRPDGHEIRRSIVPTGMRIISLGAGDVRDADFVLSENKIVLTHAQGVCIYDLSKRTFTANWHVSDGPWTPLQRTGDREFHFAKGTKIYKFDLSETLFNLSIDEGANELRESSILADGPVSTLAYDAARNRLAVLTHPPHELTVHDLASGRMVWRESLDFNSTTVRFDSRKDQYLVGTFAPGLCRVFDAGDGALVGEIDGFRGDLIGRVSEGEYVLESGGELQLLEAGKTGYLFPSAAAAYDGDRYPLGDAPAMVVSKDGRWLATESRQPRGCLIVDVETLQPIQWILGNSQQPESRPLAFSDDGRYLVTERGRSAVAIWDLETLSDRFDAFVGGFNDE